MVTEHGFPEMGKLEWNYGNPDAEPGKRWSDEIYYWETSNMNEENAREIRPGGQDEKSPVKPVGRSVGWPCICIDAIIPDSGIMDEIVPRAMLCKCMADRPTDRFYGDLLCCAA